MKNCIKALLALILFLVLFQGKIVNAQQATFTCIWLPGVNPNQDCIVDENVSDPNCDYSAGGANQLYCAGFTTECDYSSPSRCQDCNSPYFCSPDTCPTGSTPQTGFSCAGSLTNVCCLSDDITPPPATVCWECNVNGATNTCYQRQPNESGTCDPYWQSEGTCASECANFSYSTYTCDDNNGQGGYPNCKPAANGEFVGDLAYMNCQQNCNGNYVPPIYCSGDTPEEGSTTFPPDPDNPKIITAIGCIPVIDFGLITTNLLTLGLSIAGGIALLLIAIAGIIIKLSGGNPEKLKSGKNLAWGALAGLLLLTFCGFILKAIGITVLNIPGL